MTDIIVPAFCYRFLREIRGLLAWAVLRELRVSNVRRSRAVHILSARLGIDPANARRLLHAGNGSFWRLYRRQMRIFSADELWRRACRDSVVGRDPVIIIPAQAVPSANASRAYLSQVALSRGMHRPISIDTSARIAGCSKRSITRYRRRLIAEGRLQLVPQYQRRGRKDSKNIVTFGPGEFPKGDYIYRRVADIVLLRNASGTVVDLLAKARVIDPNIPRRYFFNQQEVDEWQRENKPMAKDAMLRVFNDEISTEWTSISGGSDLEKGNVRDLTRGEVPKASPSPNRLVSSRALTSKHRRGITKFSEGHEGRVAPSLHKG